MKLMETTEKFMNRLVSRPIPFQASFHGESTIIVDADGHWVTGQVPRDSATQLAVSMTEHVKSNRDRVNMCEHQKAKEWGLNNLRVIDRSYGH